MMMVMMTEEMMSAMMAMMTTMIGECDIRMPCGCGPILSTFMSRCAQSLSCDRGLSLSLALSLSLSLSLSLALSLSLSLSHRSFQQYCTPDKLTLIGERRSSTWPTPEGFPATRRR